MRQAIEDIELEIGNLRAIISDLRPSLLDDLGLLPAIDALLERRRQSGLEITGEFRLPQRTADAHALTPELETTIYRLLQETLTNVVKHAEATHVDVRVGVVEGGVLVEVTDNGHGLDAGAGSEGFGLAGLRERVYLAGGSLELDSGPWGTRVRAHLPTPASASVADQTAS